MNSVFMTPDLSHYQCVFSQRFGTPEMRSLWSEENKRLLWRTIWGELSSAQAALGVITQEQADDISRHQYQLNMQRSLEIEQDTQHDLLSEARCFAEMCPVGGGVIHLGATSADIEDNADALRLKVSLEVLDKKMKALLLVFMKKIEATKAIETMGFTHLQAAEPITVGYRLAQYLYDLHDDYLQLLRTLKGIKGKGMKGAVGSSASYVELFVARGASFEQAVSQHASMEAQVMRALGVESQLVSTQTYTRKQDVRVANSLASIAASIHKSCQDIRLLQSSPISEWYEPRGALQVGSSTMPFKRNPTLSEKVNGVCRIVMSLQSVFLTNAAHTMLERTLDDSAGRGFGLPTMFIAIDEAITTFTSIIEGLQVNTSVIKENNGKYHAITITEKILMLCVAKGAHRQHMHEHLRTLCATLSDRQVAGKSTIVSDVIATDPLISGYLSSDELATVFEASSYTGNCEKSCTDLLQLVAQSIA